MHITRASFFSTRLQLTFRARASSSTREQVVEEQDIPDMTACDQLIWSNSVDPQQDIMGILEDEIYQMRDQLQPDEVMTHQPEIFFTNPFANPTSPPVFLPPCNQGTEEAEASIITRPPASAARKTTRARKASIEEIIALYKRDTTNSKRNKTYYTSSNGTSRIGSHLSNLIGQRKPPEERKKRARKHSMDELVEQYRRDTDNPNRNKTYYTSSNGTTRTGRDISYALCKRKPQEERKKVARSASIGELIELYKKDTDNPNRHHTKYTSSNGTIRMGSDISTLISHRKPQEERRHLARKASIDELIEQYEGDPQKGRTKKTYTSSNGTTLTGNDISKRLSHRKRAEKNRKKTAPEENLTAQPTTLTGFQPNTANDEAYLTWSWSQYLEQPQPGDN